MLFSLAAILACTALIFRSMAVLLATALCLLGVFVLASLSQETFTVTNLLIAIAGFNGAIMAMILVLVAIHSKVRPHLTFRSLPRTHDLTR